MQPRIILRRMELKLGTKKQFSDWLIVIQTECNQMGQHYFFIRCQELHQTQRLEEKTSTNFTSNSSCVYTKNVNLLLIAHSLTQQTTLSPLTKTTQFIFPSLFPLSPPLLSLFPPSFSPFSSSPLLIPLLSFFPPSFFPLLFPLPLLYSPLLSLSLLSPLPLTSTLCSSALAVGFPVTHRPTKCRLSCLKNTKMYKDIQEYTRIQTAYTGNTHKDTSCVCNDG